MYQPDFWGFVFVVVLASSSCLIYIEYEHYFTSLQYLQGKYLQSSVCTNEYMYNFYPDVLTCVLEIPQIKLN